MTMFTEWMLSCGHQIDRVRCYSCGHIYAADRNRIDKGVSDD